MHGSPWAERLPVEEVLETNIAQSVNIDAAIETLCAFRDKYAGEYQRLTLETDCHLPNATKTLCLFGVRLETDDEFRARLNQEERARENRRWQYEMLKKEFEEVSY
jgi:hypothetical protein